MAANVLGNAVAHPLNTLGAVRTGVVTTFNTLTGRIPEAHPLVRTATEILNGIENDVQGIDVAVEAMQHTVADHFHQVARNQKYAMLFCALAPLGMYFGYKKLSSNNTLMIVNKIPSTDEFLFLIKQEFDKRDAAQKQAIVSITATQLWFALGFLSIMCVLLIIYIQNKRDNNNSNKGSDNLLKDERYR